MKIACIWMASIGISLAWLAGCAASAESGPEWLHALTAQLGSEPVSNPPQRILRYQYNDSTVFYQPPVCCDRPSVLYDEQGGVLCSPDGGMTGRGDGRCADFHAQKSDETLVWKDQRGS